MPRSKTKKEVNVINNNKLDTMENSCGISHYLEECANENNTSFNNDLKPDGNISYFFKEKENDNNNSNCLDNDDNLLELMKEFEEIEMKQAIEATSTSTYTPMDILSGNIEDDFLFAEMQNYTDNFTVKQLMQICDYYEITKDVKSFKCKKPEIINYLLMFENDVANFDLTMKRKQLWYYMAELKNDKYMKKFILWD